MKKVFPILLTAALLLPCCILGGCDNTQEENPSEEPKQEYIEGREIISEEEVNTFASGTVNTYGRVRVLSKGIYLPNAGTAVEFSFYGTSMTATLQSDTSNQYYRVIVDGTEGNRKAVRSNKEIELCKDLEEAIHTVRIVKCNASQNREILVKSVSTDGKFLRPEKKTGLKLEFIGDSITAGSGTLGKPEDAGAFQNSDVTRGYAYLTASALGADYSIVATDGICVKAKWALPDINMLEMYTYYSSTDKTVYDFPYEQDVVVLSMGTNDTYYKSANNKYTSEQFIADYTELLTLIRSKNPNAYIVCTFGLMFENATTEKDIQTAIKGFDDEKISYIKLPTGVNGAQSHPSEEDAKVQCVPLIEHIQALIEK